MLRRQVLGLLNTAFSSTLAAPAPALPGHGRRSVQIRAICFDLLTIFDPRGVARAADAVVPGRGMELWTAWKTRQFEYSWLRASAGKYADFEIITKEALTYAANELKLAISSAAQQRLVESYCELEPWPDARDALLGWKKAGLKLAPLTNYSPSMLARQLQHSRFEGLFDALLSTDRAKTYKPDPRAYALGPALLRLPREQIAFAAFGGWDAAGAKWSGFPTFWVNRVAATGEQLVAPDASGASFVELGRWLSSTDLLGERQ